ncbi:MAG: MarR family winged helix-turn-helix transcriptional regulator [Sphingomonadales bacterium]
MGKIDLERSVGFLMSDVARLLRNAFDRRARAMGLTRTQWWVVAHLYRNDGQTQTELAEELDMEKAPLGRLLDRLEASGWVERRPDPHDRRAKRVFKTDKIEPYITAMRQSAVEMYEVALAGLPSNKRDELIDTLLLMKTNLLTNGDSQ